MSDKNFIECCEAVLAFLLDNKEYSSFNTPCSIKMNSLLEKNFGSSGLIIFGEYLSEKYNIKLWSNSPKEFFGTDYGRSFLKSIIRDYKLELIK